MNDVRWLSDSERDAWLAYLRGSHLLERAVAQQLHDGAGLTHAEYEILSRLSESPGRRLRMGALADRLVEPKSRLTYQIDRLVARGLVRREPLPDDRRGVDAVLTEAGVALLTRIAPGHVATVRSHLVDRLDPADLESLGRIMREVAESIEPAEGD